MFKEISAKDIDGNLIKAIANEWMLISAGNESNYNMMTASWGFVGEMWGNDCAFALILRRCQGDSQGLRKSIRS